MECRAFEGIAEMDTYGHQCIQPWRSGSGPCNQQNQWVRLDFSARPPTCPHDSHIKAWRYHAEPIGLLEAFYRMSETALRAGMTTEGET